MSNKIKFMEKQYLGRNSYGLSRRVVMIIFCFIAHFYSEEHNSSTGLFLLVGVFTLTLSVLLVFIPLYTVSLSEGNLHLISLRKKVVNIPVRLIKRAEVLPYSPYHLNNPVFNVKDKEEYKFYAEGSKALLLNLEGGNVLRIGVRNAELLLSEIKKMQSDS